MATGRDSRERRCPASWFLACTASYKPFSCSWYDWRKSKRWRRRAASVCRAPPGSSAWQYSRPLLGKPDSPQFFCLPSCLSYFGLITGESQFNFPPILTKTVCSKATKQGLVGQSPTSFNINTVNPAMSSLLWFCFYCCCSVRSPGEMSQGRHQIHTASYELLQVCHFLLILMRLGAWEGSSGFVEWRAGKEEVKNFGEERREKLHVNPWAPLSCVITSSTNLNTL